MCGCPAASRRVPSLPDNTSCATGRCSRSASLRDVFPPPFRCCSSVRFCGWDSCRLPPVALVRLLPAQRIRRGTYRNCTHLCHPLASPYCILLQGAIFPFRPCCGIVSGLSVQPDAPDVRPRPVLWLQSQSVRERACGRHRVQNVRWQGLRDRSTPAFRRWADGYTQCLVPCCPL